LKIIADEANEPDYGHGEETSFQYEKLEPLYKGRELCIQDFKCLYYAGKERRCQCVRAVGHHQNKVHRTEWKYWTQTKVASAIQAAIGLTAEDAKEFQDCVYGDSTLARATGAMY
jgi:hypothetical protein